MLFCLHWPTGDYFQAIKCGQSFPDYEDDAWRHKIISYIGIFVCFDLNQELLSRGNSKIKSCEKKLVDSEFRIGCRHVMNKTIKFWDTIYIIFNGYLRNPISIFQSKRYCGQYSDFYGSLKLLCSPWKNEIFQYITENTRNISILMPCPSMGPKWFWTVQIVLDGYKLFWLGPNCFGRVQIILVRFKLDFSRLIFIIWTCPKWFECGQNELVINQNNLDGPKLFWTHRRTRH